MRPTDETLQDQFDAMSTALVAAQEYIAALRRVAYAANDTERNAAAKVAVARQRAWGRTAKKAGIDP